MSSFWPSLYVQEISCFSPRLIDFVIEFFRQATMEACTGTVRWFTYKDSSGSSSDFFRKSIYSLQIHSYFCYNKIDELYAIGWSMPRFLICHAWIFPCPGTRVVRRRRRQNHSIRRTIRNSCYPDNKRHHRCLASEYKCGRFRHFPTMLVFICDNKLTALLLY